MAMSTEAGVAYGFIYDFEEQRDSSENHFENADELEARLEELKSDYKVVDPDGDGTRVIVTFEEHNASSEMGGGFFEFNSPHSEVIEGLREIREQLNVDSPIKWYFYMFFVS